MWLYMYQVSVTGDPRQCQKFRQTHRCALSKRPTSISFPNNRTPTTLPRLYLSISCKHNFRPFNFINTSQHWKHKINSLSVHGSVVLPRKHRGEPYQIDSIRPTRHISIDEGSIPSVYTLHLYFWQINSAFDQICANRLVAAHLPKGQMVRMHESCFFL